MFSLFSQFKIRTRGERERKVLDKKKQNSLCWSFSRILDPVIKVFSYEFPKRKGNLKKMKVYYVTRYATPPRVSRLLLKLVGKVGAGNAESRPPHILCGESGEPGWRECIRGRRESPLVLRRASGGLLLAPLQSLIDSEQLDPIPAAQLGIFGHPFNHWSNETCVSSGYVVAKPQAFLSFLLHFRIPPVSSLLKKSGADDTWQWAQKGRT